MKVANKKTQQNAKQFAYQIGKGETFEATDVEINQGGFARIIGAKSVKLTRVDSKGQPSGSGVYFVIIATEPCEEFIWDNTGLDHEIVNGGEAALRVMGGAQKVTIINVNFRCRKHDANDDTGKKTGTRGVKQVFWKQVQQWRDVREGLVKGGRTIGLIDLGEQKNTAKSRQCVQNLTFENHAMTSLPSITSRSSIGKVRIVNCPKINEQGQKIGMWKDQTL